MAFNALSVRMAFRVFHSVIGESLEPSLLTSNISAFDPDARALLHEIYDIVIGQQNRIIDLSFRQRHVYRSDIFVAVKSAY